MSTVGPQNRHLDALLDKFSEGRLLFLIGAGVSHELGYPTANELAWATATYFGIDVSVSPSQLTLEALSELAVNQGKASVQEIRDYIRRSFQEISEETEKKEMLENPYYVLIKIISELSSRWKHEYVVFATPNWDEEIKYACVRCGVSFFEIKDRTSYSELKNQSP